MADKQSKPASQAIKPNDVYMYFFFSEQQKKERTILEKKLSRTFHPGTVISNGKAKEYTDKECLNLDCVLDLADDNGTGIATLSLNETFNYINLKLEQETGLENNLNEAINKLINLFVSNFLSMTSRTFKTCSKRLLSLFMSSNSFRKNGSKS